MEPLITINLVVLNGGKYIRQCLDSVLAQTYPHEFIEVNILDNGSSDGTKEIIKDFGFRISDLGFAKFFLLESKKNLGMWPGHEELLNDSGGEYVVILSVDVVLDKDFILNAVKAIRKDGGIGAVQAKIYSYDVSKNIQNSKFQVPSSKTIDTCGFQIFKSRRVINIGQGEEDKDQFSQEKEIFGVEGAVPVIRKSALESIRIMGEIADHDLFWYAEDLDVAWRLRVFGWKQIFAPDVIAWHDRQTAKSIKKHWWDYLKRISIRQAIPIEKRKLGWRNTHFTIIKNDYRINILKDLPHILLREVMIMGYTILFEPKVLGEIPTFFKLLPRILKKREQIMKRRVATSKEMEAWFK